MNKYLYLLFLASFINVAESYSQSESYIVNTTSFCSRLNDEFAPVLYRGGIVFCSDRSDNSPVSYNDDQNRLFKIFFVARKGSSGWNHPKILAKELTTSFNDGPVTFNENGNVIYYSRNNSIVNSLRNISDTSNKLGIYSAELIEGLWTNIKPFTHNNPMYSFYTPSLTPDGDRLYFSSDMPGGVGGMDLYYCDRRNNEWEQPVNLGPLINTPENETFPFACRYGKLYFASEGHNGFGGKDLFYTRETDGEWIVPVHLDSAINSPADDFGLCIDSTFTSGFFSTNRRNTDDIFSFSSPAVDFQNCDSILENNYCFTFFDEKQQLLDSVEAKYLWTFGDGIIYPGKEVRHCFPGPGKYPVSLTIIDELTGDTIAKKVEYMAELENIRQACIESDKAGIVDEPMSFRGLTSDLKDVKITDYFWDFGDGFKQGGPLIDNTFKKKGDYTVKLGLVVEQDSLGVVNKLCYMKKIKIN